MRWSIAKEIQSQVGWSKPTKGRVGWNEGVDKNYLLSSLSWDDDIELVSSVDWGRESSGWGFVARANIRHNSVEDDIRVVCDWPEVVIETDEERHLVRSLWRLS